MSNVNSEQSKTFKINEEVYYLNCYMKWFLVPVNERKFEVEYVKSKVLDIEEENGNICYWLDASNQQIYETNSMNYLGPESVLKTTDYIYKTYEEALENAPEILKKLNDRYNGK